MELSKVSTSELAILGSILEPDKPTFSPEAARAILDLDFNQADKDHMRRLSAKAQEGTLTSREKTAINNYERIGHLLNLMQSKARRTLKARRGTNGKTRTH
jgi:hypothetical protein